MKYDVIVIGAEVESSGEIFKVEANEIVLSAGAIASPQLLLLSGVGPSASGVAGGGHVGDAGCGSGEH